MSRRTSKLKQSPSVLRDINSAPAYFSDLALNLHTRGFEPVPLIAGSKACKVARWTSVTMDEAWITKMIRTHPRAGVGLRSKFTPGLDIDIDEGPLVAAMLAIVRRRFGEVLVRKGRGHRVLVPFRTDVPFSEINGMVFLRPGDQPLSDGRCEGHKIQVLADGQQFVGWAIHPDTNQPYEWLRGKTPKSNRAAIQHQARVGPVLAGAQNAHQIRGQWLRQPVLLHHLISDPGIIIVFVLATSGKIP